ncbi:hypothetical protein V9T40_003501 [Parthenolecanium corni]|uniref:Rho-GAP domain-containing protein n=1 Tax=Parthenolecanium corni TaxID=536013 RepID=A0AAN9TRE3_9HEMI
METDVSQDFQDYWNEYRIVTSDEKLCEDDNLQSQSKSDDEGLDEAEWLVLAGLSHLTDSYLRGQEIEETELEPVMNVLSLHQANAVRRRVHSLNQTIKHRPRAKHKKPDIRDVFKNVEDSKPVESKSSNKLDKNVSKIDPDPHFPPFSSLPDYININCSSTVVDAKIPSKEENIPTRREIFRRVIKPDKDVVASENADGITMLAFQRFGTVRDSNASKNCYQSPVISSTQNRNATTDPEEENVTNIKEPNNTLSLGFEYMWQQPTNWKSEDEQINVQNEEENILGSTWVDTLSEEDLVKLRPLLFVELSAVFDKAANPFPKIKPHKRKRKQEGNIFGCSLSSLVEKDVNVSKERCHVPLIFRKLLHEMEKRGLTEEGVLRVAGNKAKTENLCQAIEKDFYVEPQEIDQMLERCAIHDLTAIFKKLLRELPEPILTNELINLFYQSHRLTECEKVLNLLVLLLPVENRLTLLAIISFMRKLVKHESENKMTQHNVAMIIAPSIFPPRYIQIDKTNGNLHAQVGLAAVSCRITETLMNCFDRLNKVPCPLVTQLRHINELDKFRLKENSPMRKFLGNKKSTKGEMIMRQIDNEVDFQEGVIRVNAPQFNLYNTPIVLGKNTTAGEVVLNIAEIGSKCPSRNVNSKQLRRKDMKQRVLTELAPNGNLSCLLATADSDTALRTHFLYEIGGNIGQRCLEPTAIVNAVYKLNPNAEWLLKCDHRNAAKYNN